MQACHLEQKDCTILLIRAEDEHRLLVFPEQEHRLSVHLGEERDHQRENRQVEERKQDQGI